MAMISPDWQHLDAAFRQAYDEHRDCAIVYTTFRGFQVKQLEAGDFLGRVEFIISDNYSHPVPITETARATLAVMMYRSIGGEHWNTKELNFQAHEDFAKMMQEFTKRVSAWGKPKPKKTLKRLKRRLKRT